jgi:hypothetical protein
METAMTNVTSRWGIAAPERITGATWGARAIYSLDARNVPQRHLRRGRYVTEHVTKLIATVDILWDRQSMNGGSPEDQTTLVDWLNATGLRELRERCTVSQLSPASHDQIQIRVDGFFLLASPRRSYGYLYIGAWRDEEAASRG